MIETLINNLRWRLIEFLSKPEYIYLDINHFYSSIDKLVNERTKFLGEVRYLGKN
jgi:hypothetical protein